MHEYLHASCDFTLIMIAYLEKAFFNILYSLLVEMSPQPIEMSFTSFNHEIKKYWSIFTPPSRIDSYHGGCFVFFYMAFSVLIKN